MPPKDKSLIVFIASGLTEKEAFNLEKFCIRLYGRVDNGTGILRNMTDGGEGLSGYLFSEEERAKRSDRAKNRKPEENPMKGKSHTQQHKEYMSAIMTGANNPFYGQKHSIETRQKMSKRKSKENHNFWGKQRPEEVKEKISRSSQVYKYELLSPDGMIHVVYSLSRFCKENNLNQSHMWSVVNGSRNHHKNWRCLSVEKLKERNN